jgi:hypothetical protein
VSEHALAGKRVRPRLHRAWLSLFAAYGCSNEPSAGEVRDAAIDTIEDAAATEQADAAIAADLRPDTRPRASGLLLPPGIAPARRLLDADASLTGRGFTACSHQRGPGSSADRWCAFTKAGPSAVELWVIDVTRAAAGPVPVCDGSSPLCLRMTANLWIWGAVNGPTHPYAHAFEGDTLVFYADALSGRGEVHRGPVSVWRPGWAQPRRIGGDRTVQCWGHRQELLAFCIEDLAGDPMQPESLEVRAGAIADADGIVLPSLGRIRARGAEGPASWRADFSPAGDVFAISSPDPDPTVESLRVVATAELGTATPREIVRDVNAWQLSHDGHKLFFLRQEAAGQNALYAADFPSGEGLNRLDPSVNDYTVLGGDERDHGVAILADDGQDTTALRLIPPGAPARTVLSYRDGLEGLTISPDARFTAWMDTHFTARIVRSDDLRSCELNATPGHSVYRASFLDSAGLVFWTEEAGGDRDRRDGYLANPDGCLDKRRFAEAVYFIAPVGDRGIVFADEIDDETQRATLKYAAIPGGKEWPALGPVRVHDDIDGDSVFAASLDPLLLMFRVSGGGADRAGTYLFGPAGF